MAATEPAVVASTAATATPPLPPHFVLVPYLAQGHIIPLVDLARLLAERGARASVVTTPLNAARLSGAAEHAAHAGLPLEFVELPFPPAGSDLPHGCQNADMVADMYQLISFVLALPELAGPFDAYVRALAPRPTCIVSDWCNPWTAGVARSLGVPWLFFHGPSCFFSLCDLLAADHGLHERIAAGGDEDKHAVPGMPVPVVVTKANVPGFFTHPVTQVLRHDAMEAMRTADGAVVNTFSDLEDQFVACYEAALGKPVWAIGPLCLSNKDYAKAMASRGNKSGVERSAAITAWLDTKGTDSVVFVSFGSIARKLPKQLFEVGHGLEDSGEPFLWVVKEAEVTTPETQEWLEALEARVAGRGLVVRGWAPQLAVLSHRAVGGVRHPLRLELAAGVHGARRAGGDVAALRRPVPERAAGRGRARRRRAGRRGVAGDVIRRREGGGGARGRRAGGVGADGRRGGGRREEEEGQGIRGESSQGHGERRFVI